MGACFSLLIGKPPPPPSPTPSPPPTPPPTPPPPRRTIFVGIDFGTARSGYAYSSDTNVNVSPSLQFNWPGDHGHEAKALTALLYDKAATPWQPISWGMEARTRFEELQPKDLDNFAYIEGFKMMLSDDPDDVMAMPHPPPAGFPFDATTTIGHYLSFLKQHLYCQLERTWPDYKQMDIQYCLTIPAGWSERAKADMKQAAVLAGLVPTHDSHQLQLVHEPEAAALTACLTSNVTVKNGDVFFIIDAGGGTVDFTIHEVEENGTRLLKEATYKRCILKGSKFLDSKFEDEVAEFFGMEVFTDEWSANHPRDYLVLHSNWEAQKKTFGGSRLLDVRLPYSLVELGTDEQRMMLLHKSGYRDTYRLTIEEAREMFDSSVAEIIQTCTDMVADAARRPTKVLLVGGLGSSAYLQNRLRNAFGATLGDIIVPQYGYSAVVEGAVQHLRRPQAIVERISDLTYGFRAFARMQPHWPQELRFGNTDETDKAFLVVVRKGQAVPEGHVYKHTVQPSNTALAEGAVDLHLLSSADSNPEYMDGDRVKVVETIHIPLPVKQSIEAKYLIELTLVFTAAEIRVTVRGLPDGEPMKASITFNGNA